MSNSKVWTPTTSATLVSAYTAGATLEELSTSTGKTVNSVRAKLVSEKVYVAKVRATNTGGVAVTRKLAHVRAIETCLSVKVGSLSSLEKGTKAELETLFNAIVSLGETKETK